MSIILKNALLAFTIRSHWGSHQTSSAQTTPAAPSVLPTGGGQALLDLSVAATDVCSSRV